MTTEATINRIFESFANQRILVVGDLMLDAYYFGRVDRISPEAPVPIVSVTRKDRRPGGAANVAINIQALGATPILCSVRGNDVEGEWLQHHFTDHGLETSGIVIDSGRPTTVKTRIIGNNQQVLRVDEETTRTIDKTIEQQLLSVIKGLMPTVGAVVFEDYNKGLLSKSLISKVIRMARDLGIPTLVDPKLEHFLDYKGVTLFKPNRKEIIDGLKLDSELNDRASINEALQMLSGKLGIEHILLTLSQMGVAIYTDGQTNYYPAHERKILDVSGAGDSVISVAALCAAVGVDWQMTARLSNLAGGLVCERLGVVPIDRDVLLEQAIHELS